MHDCPLIRATPFLYTLPHRQPIELSLINKYFVFSYLLILTCLHKILVFTSDVKLQKTGMRLYHQQFSRKEWKILMSKFCNNVSGVLKCYKYMFKIYLLLEKRILNPRWFYSVLHKEKSKVLLLYVDLSLIKNSYKVIVLYVASFHLGFFPDIYSFL